MERAILVANPAASQFTGSIHRATLRALARRFAVESTWPADANQAGTVASEAARSGASLVVAMGGDGIVHHVAQGLVGTRTVLGVIPVGTTNVFARLVGVPTRPAGSVKALAGGYTITEEPVLTVDATGPAGSLHRSVLFALGVGPDAEVVERAESEPYRKYRFGSVHYARTAVSAAWSTLRKMDPTVEVTAGSRTGRGIGLMVQFRSAYTYFGRSPLQLDPDPPDPMTVLMIREFRMRRALAVARAALGRRGFRGTRGFELWPNADEVTLRADPPVLAQADGELLGHLTGLRATRHPAALRVAVPRERTSAD